MSKPVKVLRVAVAVIDREGSYLVTQRLETSLFPGLWEFPGGRVRDGESLEDTLSRTLHTRLGVRPLVGEVLSSKRHAYADYEVTLTMVQCTINEGDPKAIEVADLKWVPTKELDGLDWVLLTWHPCENSLQSWTNSTTSSGRRPRSSARSIPPQKPSSRS